MMAMLPSLMTDAEFAEHLTQLESDYQAGFPDLGKATEHMAILCDNAYRRVNDSSCTAHLPVNVDGSGNVMRVSTTHIDAGNFQPDNVVAGMFSILASSNIPTKLEIKEATPHSDFVGKYVLDPGRTLSAYEQALVPGGITYENVKKLMGLPDLDDMDYDPAGTYQKLTGVEKANATSQDCMGMVMEMVTDKLQQLCKVQPENSDGRQNFIYVETDFIRALKHGYLVEIQERATRSWLKRSRTNSRLHVA